LAPISQQSAAPLSQTSAAVLNDSDLENATPYDDRPEAAIANIQAELAFLSVRQAEVRERIQHLRHALVELVHVFGPEILATNGRGSEVTSADLSRGATRIMDLCRKILSCTTEWFTLYQIVGMIREEFPSALSGFLNPGVSVSNALRALGRRGEVEPSKDQEPASWRWAGERKA
jgi:hypothetical protein